MEWNRRDWLENGCLSVFFWAFRVRLFLIVFERRETQRIRNAKSMLVLYGLPANLSRFRVSSLLIILFDIR